MDRALKEQLVNATLRFKRTGMMFSSGLDIHMGELIVMKAISSHISCSDRNVYVSDIQGSLYITKPAVSQLLNALEKKGYVRRRIDEDDRRKIAVTLTSKGRETLKRTTEDIDRMLGTVIVRLGEENARELIRLFTRLADIAEELKQEASKANKRGDDRFD
jgi:DNA-binding MarR family transcriptional regulator